MTNEEHDKMLERVRKLLAKAEANGVTEQEAQALTAKAAELMAKYSIDRALLETGEARKAVPANKFIQCPNPWGRVHMLLLSKIATAVGGDTVWFSSSKRVHLFAYDTDIERIEVLYTSILLQMHSQLRKRTAEKAGTWQWESMETRQKAAWSKSYLMGYIEGAVEKIEEAEHRVVQEVVAEKGKSTELVLVDRSLVVKQQLKSKYAGSLRTSYVRSSGSGHGDGYSDGRSANIGGAALRRPTAGALR